MSTWFVRVSSWHLPSPTEPKVAKKRVGPLARSAPLVAILPRRHQNARGQLLLEVLFRRPLGHGVGHGPSLRKRLAATAATAPTGVAAAAAATTTTPAAAAA